MTSNATSTPIPSNATQTSTTPIATTRRAVALHPFTQPVPRHYIRDTVVNINDVQKPEFNMISENTIIVGMILNIHKAEPNQRLPVFNTLFKGPSKFLPQATQEKYDRYISIADLSNPDGKCFCLLLVTNKQTRELLSQIQDSVCIGDIVQIIEPKATNRSLSNITGDLPIFTTSSPLQFYPDTTMNLLTYPYNIPDNQTTKFFLLQAATITIRRATMQHAICGGQMCDRAGIPTVVKTCGCMFESTSCKLVLQMDLYCHPKDCNDVKDSIFVENYRSWKLTKLLIDDLTRSTTKDIYSDSERKQDMRAAILRIENYVNGNGGWQIAGWFRVGSLQDAADKGVKIPSADTMVTAPTVTTHVVSLTPQNPATLPMINTLKYHLPTIDITHHH